VLKAGHAEPASGCCEGTGAGEGGEDTEEQATFTHANTKTYDGFISTP
jgi:hypothetical protein